MINETGAMYNMNHCKIFVLMFAIIYHAYEDIQSFFVDINYKTYKR